MADEDVERAAVEEILKSTGPPDVSGEPTIVLSTASLAAAEATASAAAAAAVAVVDFSIPPPILPSAANNSYGASGSMSAGATAAALAAGSVHWSQRGRTDLVSTLRNPIRPRGDGRGGGGGRGRGGPDVVTTLRNPPGSFGRGRRKFIGLDDEDPSDEERRDRWSRTRDGTRKEYDPDGDYIYDARKYFDPDKYRQICVNRRKKMDKQMEVEEAAEAQHRSYLAYMSGHYPYVKPVITRPLPAIRTDSDSDEFDYDYYEEITRAETLATEIADRDEQQFGYDDYFIPPYPEPGMAPFDEPPGRRFEDPMFYDYGGGYNDFYHDRRGPPGPGGPWMDGPPPGPPGPPDERFGDRFRGPPYEGRDEERRERRSHSRGTDRARSYSRSPGKRIEEGKGDTGPPEANRRYGDKFDDRYSPGSGDRSPSGRRFPDDRGQRYDEGFADRGRRSFDRGGFPPRGRFRDEHDFGRGGYHRPYDRHFGRGGSRYDRPGYPEPFDSRRGERWPDRRGERDSIERDQERRQFRGISQNSGGRRRHSHSKKSYSSSSCSPDTKKKQQSELAANPRNGSADSVGRRKRRRDDGETAAVSQRASSRSSNASRPSGGYRDKKRLSSSPTRGKGRGGKRGAARNRLSHSSYSSSSDDDSDTELRKRQSYKDKGLSRLKSKPIEISEEREVDDKRRIKVGNRSPGRGRKNVADAVKVDSDNAIKSEGAKSKRSPSKRSPSGRSASASRKSGGTEKLLSSKVNQPPPQVSNVRKRNFRNRSSSSTSSSSLDSKRIIKAQIPTRKLAMDRERAKLKSQGMRTATHSRSTSSSSSYSGSSDEATRKVRYGGAARRGDMDTRKVIGGGGGRTAERESGSSLRRGQSKDGVKLSRSDTQRHGMLTVDESRKIRVDKNAAPSDRKNADDLNSAQIRKRPREYGRGKSGSSD